MDSIKPSTREITTKTELAKVAGLEVVNRTMGGTIIVSQDNLPAADKAEYLVSKHYVSNMLPYGIVIGQFGTTYIQDLANDKRCIAASGKELSSDVTPIWIYNSITVRQPDMNKSRFVVKNNPDSYGTFYTYEEALAQAMSVLKAERLGVFVESELQKSLRLTGNG